MAVAAAVAGAVAAVAAAGAAGAAVAAVALGAAAAAAAGPMPAPRLAVMTHRASELARPTPGQIADRVAPPQHESGTPHPRFDALPESMGGTMRFYRREIYAHAAPHSLGSISCASTPLRALSTRKAAEPREVDIKNKSSACELLLNDFAPGSISPFKKELRQNTRGPDLGHTRFEFPIAPSSLLSSAQCKASLCWFMVLLGGL